MNILKSLSLPLTLGGLSVLALILALVPASVVPSIPDHWWTRPILGISGAIVLGLAMALVLGWYLAQRRATLLLQHDARPNLHIVRDDQP